MIKKQEARKELQIDINQLDYMCINQVSLFEEVSQRYAKAVAKKDKLKDDVVVKKAKIAIFIRSDMSNRKEKITETQLVELVTDYKDVRMLQKEYLEAKANADEWGAIKESFVQRASMLKEICSLYNIGYFADSTITQSTDIKNFRNQSNRDKVKKALKKKNE